ncbi:MAG: FkbM family methyltransferase [Verrucomicrobia bacterium]|nr:FkbM family methyltransferase [Verrucomicrobiota bacterium]
MSFVSKLRRSLQKRFRPTERDKVMRRWKADQGDAKLRLNYSLNQDSVVFDMGGYEGQWAYDIHARYGCRVFIFEPVQAYADAIAARFAGNAAIQVFSCGLAASTRNETIGLCSDGSSVFRQAERTEKIQLIDVFQWFNEHGITEIALMKINIEGGEYELLERMIDTGIASRIEHFQIQFHDLAPESEARMQAIQKHLQLTHSPTYQYKFVWENWKRKG